MRRYQQLIRGLLLPFSGSLSSLWLPPIGQLPFLDFLRSIAVLLVINGHLSAEFAELHGQTFYSRLPFVTNGWTGVDLFFALSGFFIGGQLWREMQKRGTISISRFVLRRGLRIWPLFFFTFGCVLLFDRPFAMQRAYGWSDLAFLTNYLNHGIVLGGWSLCTEEQFYILAPLLLFIFPSRDIRRYQPWLWLLLFAPSVTRIIIWMHSTGGHFFRHSPELFAAIYYPFHTHCDGLIMGLIISNYWTAQKGRRPSLASPIAVTTGFIALIVLRYAQKEVFGFAGLALFFGSLVWMGLRSRSVLLRSRLFYWISRLSFGMYLNHAYMVAFVTGTVLPVFGFKSGSVSQILGFGVLTAMSAGVSLLTYCLIEFPFLQLRARILERNVEHGHTAATAAPEMALSR